MRFHAIGGLPRAGSTLLCNLLNQNSKFHASSTSFLPQIISILINSFSTNEEIRSFLIDDKEKTEKVIINCLKGMIDGRYSNECTGKIEVIFDKGRGWGHNILSLEKIYPDVRLFVLVRDLRSVLASIEKQHQKFTLLDPSPTNIDKTLRGRAINILSSDGIVGAPLNGITDLITRNRKSVVFIRYEDFTAQTKSVMDMIYKELDEPVFEHDFNDVKNTSTDVDGLYLYKFPHKGNGKIVSPPKEGWRDYVPQDVADEIISKFKTYNEYFGYA